MTIIPSIVTMIAAKGASGEPDDDWENRLVFVAICVGIVLLGLSVVLWIWGY